MGLRSSYKHHGTWSSTTYNQRARFDLTLNQNFGDNGNLYISGSIQDYYHDHKPDYKLQLGYGKVFANGVSVNFSINCNQFGVINYSDTDPVTDTYSYRWGQGKKETSALLSFSFPLGRAMNAPSITGTINQNRESGTSYQTSVSGILGESNAVNYSLNYASDSRQHSNTINGSLQSRLPFGMLSVSASHSKEYWLDRLH